MLNVDSEEGSDEEESLQKLLDGRAKISKKALTEKDRLKGGSFQYLQYLSIAKNLQLRLMGNGKIAASEIAAKAYFQSGHIYKARCIRNWTAHYLQHNTVPLFQ